MGFRYGIEEAANELLGRESILSAYNKPQFDKLVEEYDNFKEAVRANSTRRELVDLKAKIAPLVERILTKSTKEYDEKGAASTEDIDEDGTQSGGTLTPPHRGATITSTHRGSPTHTSPPPIIDTPTITIPAPVMPSPSRVDSHTASSPRPHLSLSQSTDLDSGWNSPHFQETC